MLWRAMVRTRKKIKNSGLMADRMAFEEKQSRFQEESRRQRRRFAQITEERLNKGEHDAVTEAIRTGARKRRNREREQTSKGDPLNTADFTEFMGTHHDQRQERKNLGHFTMYE